MAEILNDWEYRQARAGLHKASTRNQAVTLASAIASYEALKMSGGLSMEINSFEDLGLALIKARVSRGWTQERLAETLGMPKQQVQRYEATKYRSANLQRLQEVSEVLDLHLEGSVLSADFSEEGS